MALEEADLSPLERDSLRVIAECVTVPVDQLARFLARDLCSVRSLVVSLEAKGCLYQRQFLPGDQPWVWLTSAGSRLSGTGFGRRHETPSVRALRHRRAIHEVRLFLEKQAPRGRWVPERQLFRMRERECELPDGLFEVEGERHAVEVELTRKSNQKLRRIAGENVRRYDALIYFCTRTTRAQLDQLKAETGWANLIVRDLPGQGPKVVRKPRSIYREPEDWEISVLRFIFEQRALSVDQLSRLPMQIPVTAEAMVERFRREGFVRSGHLTVGEPEWVWVVGRGARVSGLERSGATGPSIGDLPWLRALTDLRLQAEARSPKAGWTSRRMLLRDQGGIARVPDAVIETGSERHALNVRLTRPQSGTRLPSKIDLLSRNHDAVIYLCGDERVRAYMERLQERHQWSKLVIRDLQSGGAGAGLQRSFLLDSLP